MVEHPDFHHWWELQAHLLGNLTRTDPADTDRSNGWSRIDDLSLASLLATRQDRQSLTEGKPNDGIVREALQRT